MGVENENYIRVTMWSIQSILNVMQLDHNKPIKLYERFPV